MSLKNEKFFHFIAVGGIGMSGLARFLLEKGYKISGSDIKENANTKRLKKLGAKISIGHNAANVKPNMTVIVSSAVPENNCELLQAKKLGLRILHRSDMLVHISRKFSDNNFALFFGFSGTHGKTTTSGLCSYVLSKAGFHPSFVIGGIIPELETNSRCDSTKIFIAELDESDGTITKYKPDISIINNLSFDHPDFYKNGMSDIFKIFKKYIDGLKTNAVILMNNDDEGCAKFAKFIPNKKIFTFGLKDADYAAKNIHYKGFGSSFEIYKSGKILAKINLSIPGKHNVYNSLAVFSALDLGGFHPEKFDQMFKSFMGVNRRFQRIAKFNGITVIDDYAHHPEQIKTTLESIANVKNRKVVVFQPHRYTRLKRFWNDFLMSFEGADKLVVVDVFAASEKPIKNINSKNFVKAFNTENCIYIGGSMETVAKKLYPMLKSGDIVITFGAGDITGLGRFLATKK